jgi:replicative DNA helicase
MSVAKTQRFVSALTTLPAKDWHKLGVRSSLLEPDATAVKMFDFMSAFVREHGKVPSLQTVNEKFNATLAPEASEAEFLLVQLQEQRVKRRLSIITHDLAEMSKTDPMKALQVLNEEASGLISEMTTTQVYDFKNAIELAWPWLVQKWSGQVPSVPIVWPSLQAKMGGIQGGEVFSIVGRPGMGKSYALLHAALHIWEQTKRPVLFVSMEIMRRNIMTRLASMYTKTPADWFKHGDTPTIFGENKKLKVQKALKTLSQSDLSSFHVVDGNLSATTDDIVGLARACEPAAVFVDGAYMLKVPQRGFKQHERIEEITSSLKRDIATNMDMPVFASWQFNREATKLKKDSTPSLEHIAGGDFIGYISSVVLGLLDDPATVDGNAAHAGRRRLRVLKGRDGETGDMILKWDFSTMDFSEIEETGEKKEEYGLDD